MTTFIKITTALILCSASAFAADWPAWRGPNQAGISTEKITLWNAESGPKVLWKANVGPGCSSFTVVGDRVFTMGNSDKDTGAIYCLNANTGEIVWKHSFPSPIENGSFEGGQCGTPTIDGNRVYALGRQGQFFCLNKETGAVVWSKDFLKDFGAKPAKWGYSGSAFILGKAVFMDVGGPEGASSIAFDKETGAIIWQAGNDPQSYGTPYLFTQDGKQRIAFFTATGLVARDAADGRETLRFPWKTAHDVHAAMPIVDDGKMFITSGYNVGSALFPIDSAEPKAIWQNKNIRGRMHSCVLWKGHLYGFDHNILACVDFATGELKWQQEGMGESALMMDADGKLIIQAETGDLVIAEATPEAYKELARAETVVPKRSWIVPVLSNGKLFCGNNMGEVTVLDLAANKK